MTYVVTEKCIKCKYQECVLACPTTCFHAGPDFVVIDPVECVDCGTCVEYCPIGAIKEESELTASEQCFTEINRELSLRWPLIESKGEVPEDADDWVTVKGKVKYLSETSQPEI